MAKLIYKKLTQEDIPVYLDLVEKMAVFEKLDDGLVATPELVQKWIIEEEKLSVYLLEEEGTAIGYVCFFDNFSTFLSRPGLYLEDLFILPDHRGKDYGKRTLDWLAKIAVDRGYGRFEWICLDWNQNAIDFYERYGAEQQKEWRIFRITGDKLKEIGSRYEE